VRKKLKRFRLPIFALSILFSFYLTCSQYDSPGKILFLSPIALENLEDEEDENEEDLAIDSPVQSGDIVLTSVAN